MNKLFCILLTSVLFTACQDEILVEQRESRNDAGTNQQKCIKVDDGITYQRRKFFINGIDGRANVPHVVVERTC